MRQHLSLDDRINRLRELTRVKNEVKGLELSRSAILRAPSTTETQRVYHPWGHGLFFCVHDKHYFVSCRNCQRTFADGEQNALRFATKYNVLLKQLGLNELADVT